MAELWRSAHRSEPAAVTVGLQLSLLLPRLVLGLLPLVAALLALVVVLLVVVVGDKGGGVLWVTHKVKTRERDHEFNKSETGAAADEEPPTLFFDGGGGGGGVLRLVENKQYGGS